MTEIPRDVNSLMPPFFRRIARLVALAVCVAQSFFDGQRSSNLWARTGSTWSIVSSDGPPLRAEHRGVYAPGLGFVIFGGIGGQGMSLGERQRSKLNDLSGARRRTVVETRPLAGRRRRIGRDFKELLHTRDAEPARPRGQRQGAIVRRDEQFAGVRLTPEICRREMNCVECPKGRGHRLRGTVQYRRRQCD